MKILEEETFMEHPPPPLKAARKGFILVHVIALRID